MTPKEKANKLCMRFLIETTTDIPYGINKNIAKQCALIAVDEILTWLKAHQYSNKNYDAFVYYNEVKQEIEAL
jgi:hypothetical protein